LAGGGPQPVIEKLDHGIAGSHFAAPEFLIDHRHRLAGGAPIRRVISEQREILSVEAGHDLRGARIIIGAPVASRIGAGGQEKGPAAQMRTERGHRIRRRFQMEKMGVGNEPRHQQAGLRQQVAVHVAHPGIRHRLLDKAQESAFETAKKGKLAIARRHGAIARFPHAHLVFEKRD
jgi:hypothetical protein